MNILLTGGLGYIGSHVAVSLLEKGHQVVIADNLSNSKFETLHSINKIVKKTATFCQGDVRDQAFNESLLAEYKIEVVIHLAGLKAVGESTKEPLIYFDHNVTGTIALLKAMEKNCVKKLIFSSSATVYGVPVYLPLDEKHPTNPENPYGKSKLIIEEILKEIAIADPLWSIVVLRYFNPVGAHPSGLIGENPRGIPNNLMPFVSQVATGQLDCLSVFGNDYKTHDGTGVRDYIHVMDLASGHEAALLYLFSEFTGITTINLGTGTGYSVIDLVRAFEKVSGKKIPYEIKPRRKGDIDSCFALSNKAKLLLNWQAKHGLEKMCEDSWRWQSSLISNN